MTYGIQIKGSHGFIQIDQDYQNLFVRASGVATVANSPQGSGNLTVVNIPTLTDNSLIAISGSTPTIVVLVDDSNNVSFYSVASAGAQFTWWVFDTLAGLPTSGVGLIVRKPITLEPVFSSASKPMRVLASGAVSPPSYPPSGSNQPSGHGDVIGGGGFGGKTIAWATCDIAQMNYSGGLIGQGATPNYVYVTVPGGNLTYYQGHFATFGGGPDARRQHTGQILLLDVTGF